MQPLTVKAFLLLLCMGVSSIHAQHQIQVFTKKDGLTSVAVSATLVDSKGIVWFGTDNGLNAWVNSQWFHLKQIEDNKSGKSLLLGKTELIFEDRKRNVWISTSNGLFLFNGEYWTNFKQKTEEEGYIVKDIFEDRQGRIWCTLEKHQDLSDIKEFQFNFVSGKLLMFDHIKWYNFDDDLASTVSLDFKTNPKYFSAVFQDRAGEMWFGTLKGIYKFDMKEWTKFEKDVLKAEKVFKMITSKKSGEHWAATEGGVSRFVSGEWINYSKKDGLAGAYVYDLCEDPVGRKWAFIRSELKFSGLSMHDGNNWKTYTNDDLKIKGFVNDLIWDDDAIIAFSDDGVAKFSSGKWHRFGKKDGLKDDSFSNILKDRFGEIWLAGNTGFYLYSSEKWEQVYQPAKEWEVSVIYVDKNRHVWVGTDKSGLFYYDGDTWVQYVSTNALTDQHVLKIFEDKKGNIWVVTKKGISLFSSIPDQ